ncbi:MAG TPA: DUF6576 domain-containing protein [Chthoniobacteraceae bacterium]|nr:DUF6576 domain-containing protein [Chthoniobacteraceae bacterium]
MTSFRESEDFGPLTWIRGRPVYLTTLLVALHVTMLVAVSLAFAFGHKGVADQLAFRSTEVLGHGAVWQALTYYVAQSPYNPIFFALEMFLLYIFGLEVEKYLGRRRFLLLTGLLILVPPLLLTFLGLFIPTALAGSQSVHFAFFIAFATLYPRVEFFLRIQARWLAFAFLGLYGLFYLSGPDWSRLCALFGNALTAYLFIEGLRGNLSWPRFPSRRGWSDYPASHPGAAEPEAQALPRRTRPRQPESPAADDPVAAIDPLLDKIASQGIGSLTEQERKRLDQAREELLNRSRR